MSAPVLEVSDLSVRFQTRDGPVHAVSALSFSVAARETLAIVGESGCGKSVTALALLRLLPAGPTRCSGSIRFRDVDLLGLPESEMRAIRGNDIAMIFQEPMTSLNPVLTIGRQIAETLRLHQGLDRRAALARAAEMLERVRIPEARRRLRDYPHQLSGGMRQRVMIAMALACNPALLVADEPTTALDVTTQAQILELMRTLKASSQAAIVLITHDLGVVAEMAQRVIVMYAGAIVEEAPVAALFAAARHPYTRGLLAALPQRARAAGAMGVARLAEIPGVVPVMRGQMEGCAFADRCAQAIERCRREWPVLAGEPGGHRVACHLVAVGGVS